MPQQQTQGVQIKGRDAEDFATLTPDGAKVRLDVSTGLSSLPGFCIPPFDRIDASYPTDTQEVYVYSLGGDVVNTLTVNYTDSSKLFITSAIKT